jgi:hypothetical protein
MSLEKQINELKARIAELEQGWQPIATAPKENNDE